MIKMAQDKNTGKLAKWTIGEEYMKLVLRKTEEFYKASEDQNWDLAKLKATSLTNLTSYYIIEKGKKKDIDGIFNVLDTLLDNIKKYHDIGELDKEKEEKKKIIIALYKIVEEITVIFSQYGAYLIIAKGMNAVQGSLQM